jgi:hypothetical protein
MRKNLNVFVIVAALGLLLLQPACVAKEFPVIETYEDVEYKTEYTTETYTEVVKTVVEDAKGRNSLVPVSKWFNSLYYSQYRQIPATYYYGYFVGPVPHSKGEIVIHLSRGVRLYEGIIKVYDLTGMGQIPQQPTSFSNWGPVFSYDQAKWTVDFNRVLGNARVLGQAVMGPGAPEDITFDARGVWEFAILVNSYLDHSIYHVELYWVDETAKDDVVTKQRQVPQEVPYKVQKQRTVTEVRKVPFWEALFSD